MAPFSTSKKQNRQLRLDQAKFICDSAFHGNSWDLAIIGMDMNDTPDSTVYRVCYWNCIDVCMTSLSKKSAFSFVITTILEIEKI